MATVQRTKTWVSGDTLTASDLNAEFNNLLNALALVNADISGSAAIAYSKLNLTGGIVNADINSSAAIAVSKIATGLSGDLVGTTDTQTLTNKTLTKPTVNGSVQAYTTDTDGATITFNMSASNVHTVTLGGNRTLAVSNVSTGQAFVIILKQDGTGSRTVTWWSGILWTSATAPTLTTTASRYDIFSFVYDGTNYFGSIVGQNYG